MRKINLKLLLWLMAGTAVVVAAVFVVHYFQSRRIAVALLWQADRARDQRQPDREVDYLRRYLEFVPRDVERQVRLARLLAGDDYAGDLKARRMALGLLNRLPPDGDPGLRRLLVRVALELGGNPDNCRRAREVLAGLGVKDGTAEPPPGMDAEVFGELKGYQGWLYDLEKNKEGAAAACELAVRFAPHLRENYERLAWLLRDPRLRGNDDPQERARNAAHADEVVELLVRNNHDGPDAARAYLLRWTYRRHFGLLDLGNDKGGQVPLAEAMDDVAQARKRAPELAEVLLADADLSRLQEARAAEGARHALRKQTRATLERGLALQAKPGYRGATEYNSYHLRWQLANVLLDDLYDETWKAGGDRRSALVLAITGHVAELRKIKSAQPAMTDFVEGRLLLYEKAWAEARDRFAKARTVLAPRDAELTAQVDLYLARCYDQLDDYDQMFAAYQNVLTYEPGSVVARLGMAAARRAQGRLAEAAQLYRDVAEEGKLPNKAWIELARLEVRLQQLKDRPEDRRWGGAEEALKRAAELDGESAAEIALLRAEIRLAGDGDEKKAEADLRALLDEERDIPHKEHIYSSLIELERGRKNTDGAEKLLRRAEKELGDKAELRLARARLLADGKKGADVAKAILPLKDGHDKFPPEEQSRLLAGLTEILFAAGQANEAWDLCVQLSELPQHRADLKLQLVLFDLALKGGNDRNVEKSLEAIASLERSQSVFHPFAKALRLLGEARKATDEAERDRQLDAASRELDRITTNRAAWAPLHRARAEVYRLKGNKEKAADELQAAYNNGDKSPAFVKELVVALSSAGRTADADRVIQEQGAALRRDTELRHIATSVALQTGDVGRALDLARITPAEGAEKTPEDLLFEARVLGTTKPDEAADQIERNLREVIRQKPSDPEAYVALVKFLMTRRKPKAAEKVLDEARAGLKGADVPLTLGQCHEAMGRTDKAGEEYDRAVKEQGDDARVVRAVAMFRVRAGKLSDAEELLRRLVGGRLKAGPEDVAWARRALAMVLSARNDAENFREALALVGLRLDAEGRLPRDVKPDENTENQRARARVLATQPSRPFRDKAIEIFEGLARSGIDADDSYLLALLYDAAGDWAKSRAVLLELATKSYDSPVTQAQPQTAQYIAQLIQGLIINKELDQAEVWLKRLQGLEKKRNLPKGALATVDLESRLLERQGKRDAALDLLRDYARRDGAKPTDLLLVIGAMARQERFLEAFDLWPQVAKTCPPEVAGGVSVALLREMKPTDEQVLGVEKWLREAIQKHPDLAVLHIHLAQIYDMRGRYHEAEVEYRAVLEKEPGNVVALNNLAWLLAHRSGEAAKALPLIEAAVRGQGRRADLLDTRAVVQLALGRTDAALGDLKEAIADTATPARLFHLARAHHQARDKDNAVRALTEAKKKGLKVNDLHPVEQQACRELLAEYGVR